MTALKDFFVKKILFPKTISVDYQGIIFSETTRMFSRAPLRRRNIMMFEDVLSGLQTDTAKKIGQEKTDAIWKEIGIKTGLAWIAQSSAKQMAVPKVVEKEVLQYAFGLLASSGGSCASSVKIGEDSSWLEISGSNNAICRKTDMPGFAEGFASIVLRSITGYEYSSIKLCKECPGGCHIRFTRTNEMSPLPARHPTAQKRNEGALPEKAMGKNSLSEFIRFKKITISDDGKLNLNGDICIIPTIPQTLEVIYEEYQHKDMEKILLDSFKRSVARISRRVFLSEDTKQNTAMLESMLSAMGMGILETYYYKDRIKSVILLPTVPDATKNRFYSAMLCFFYSSISKKTLRQKKAYSSGEALCLEFS